MSNIKVPIRSRILVLFPILFFAIFPHDIESLSLKHLHGQRFRNYRNVEVDLNHNNATNITGTNSTFSKISSSDNSDQNEKDHPEVSKVILPAIQNLKTLPRLGRHRRARLILGNLNRQSCFAKVLCGLGNKEPTTNMDLINDYAYLLGELVVDSEEDKKPQKTLKDQVEDDNSESDDNEDNFQDWLSVADYRIHTGNIPGPGGTLGNRRRPRPRPKLFIRPHWRIERLGRQLRAGGVNNLQGSRQCRALSTEGKASSKCPYDDTQMTDIVSKLRQVMQGDDQLATLAMSVLGTPNSQSVGSVQMPKGSSGRMQFVLNLQQNLTMPQSGGFAAVPFIQTQTSPWTLQSLNPSQYQQDPYSLKPTSSPGLQPFYILPLPPVPPPATTPIPVPETSTQDPVEKLVGFLYSVKTTEGTLQGQSDFPKDSTTTTTTSTTPASEGDDDEDAENEESDEQQEDDKPDDDYGNAKDAESEVGEDETEDEEGDEDDSEEDQSGSEELQSKPSEISKIPEAETVTKSSTSAKSPQTDEVIKEANRQNEIDVDVKTESKIETKATTKHPAKRIRKRVDEMIRIRPSLRTGRFQIQHDDDQYQQDHNIPQSTLFSRLRLLMKSVLR